MGELLGDTKENPEWYEFNEFPEWDIYSHWAEGDVEEENNVTCQDTSE